MVQHHLDQKPNVVVEMPSKYHKLKNKKQHPNGNKKGKGLSKEERKKFNNTRKKLNRKRAREEIERREK